MKKILGIDLGTNSLGWALVAENEALLDGGVIIFPKGNNEDPKTGKESSYSQLRTQYRGARRRLYRRKLRRRRVLEIAQKFFGLNENDIFKDTSPLSLYKLRYEGLERILQPDELFRVCLYFAKKRGFLSNRKDLMKENNKDLGTVKKGISDLEELIRNSGSRTLGEYYFNLISDHFKGKRLEERILERWTSRHMYEEEIDKIFNTQINLSNPHFNIELGSEIKKQIFYQRPLKSAKNLVGKCRLESSKRCMPRSHPVFQEFRAWQNINNLKWANPDTSEFGELNLDQKMKLVQLLKSDLKPTEAKIKKSLGFSTRIKFSEIELVPCRTEIQINKILQDEGLNLSDETILKIYHCLLFTGDAHFKKLSEHLKTKFNLELPVVEKLWSADHLKLEQDYSNISHKAAQRLLPFMKKGMRYDEACVEAGYHHSFENKFKNLPQVRSLKTNELRNPVVQKAVSVCIALVNQLIGKHGKPDEVRIELARELKKPKAVREQIRYKNILKKTKRDQYREVLENHFDRTIAYSDSILTKYELWLELGCMGNDFDDFEAFTKEVKKSDLEKYKLWLEADRISPYSGKVISLSDLISNQEIEIEHILPFSRSLDNSFANKTLCERSINSFKTNLTPLEYFERRPEKEKTDFQKRIARFSNPFKKSIFLTENLPDSFTNSQLSDTAYIARKSVEKLSECIEKVYTTKGGVTHMIRKDLGLNSILHYEGTPDVINEMKNRGDHRHHFIDAVVIAATSQSLIQKISRATESGNGNPKLNLEPPWPRFRSDLEDMVNGLLIVHKFPKKLVRSSINKYKHDKRPDKKRLIQKSLRGPLHEDTLYGKITNPYTGEENYVVTKRIINLNEAQLDKIVDEKIKQYLKELIDKNGSWAQTIKDPILFNGKPLRRVRMINNSSSLPILRENTKTYIEPGNNYALVIYEGENGKRDYLSLSFYNAIKNKKELDQLYPPEINGKKILFCLTHYDKFLIYTEHSDEIDWNNFEDLNGRIYHVIKFTNNNIYLGKSILSRIQADKDKMPLKLQCNSNTIKAIKVKLNLLGEIYWRSDIGLIKKA